MQNSFASYCAWCKRGKFRSPFQPLSMINIVQLGNRKDVLMLVWSRRFGSKGMERYAHLSWRLLDIASIRI